MSLRLFKCNLNIFYLYFSGIKIFIKIKKETGPCIKLRGQDMCSGLILS